MKNSSTPLRQASRLGYVLVYLAVLLLATPVLAQDDKGDEKEKTHTLSEWGFTRLNKAYKAFNEQKYKEALEALKEMKDRVRLPDHDRAMMWQTYGNIYTLQNNYPKAVESFQKALDMNAMSKAVTTQMKYDLGQLLLATKQYKRAIALLEEWLAMVENPQPRAYHLMAMAYAQNKQYQKALEFMNIAISKTPKPSESWLQFQLSLNYQLNKFAEVARILERLVTKFPKRTYWLQLAMMYSQLKRMKEALAVFELAYLQGHVQKESEYINLASLYMQQAIPIKAAKVMEEGLEKGSVKKQGKSYRMIADAWLYARETEEAVPWLKLAAKDYKNGDLYVQLGQIYLDKENWAEAVKQLNLAVKKGKLSSPGITHLLIGMARMSQRQYGAAVTAFSKAATFQRTKNSATQWIGIAKTKMREKSS